MNLTTETVPLDALTVHPRNVRQGDVGAISESLKAHGQYRPIVVQRSTGHILAGNHTFKAAQALGWSEIAVTYLDVSDDEGMRILLADNRTNDLATYDDAGLVEVLRDIAATETGLTGTAFDDDDFDRLIRDADLDEADQPENRYTMKASVPQYEVVGEQPAISSLYDTSKYQQLLDEIAAVELTDDVRRFLELAAARHIVFNYQKAAEFYPHAPAPIQRLMESSVMIIIDLDDAIARGYAQLASTLSEIQHDDEE